jgi:hypothetical protein
MQLKSPLQLTRFIGHYILQPHAQLQTQLRSQFPVSGVLNFVTCLPRHGLIHHACQSPRPIPIQSDGVRRSCRASELPLIPAPARFVEF